VPIIRTIALVFLVFGLLVFSAYNWQPVEVNIWDNLVLETKVPVLVLLAFLLGFAPLFAYHQSVKWSLKRRVRHLESSLKSLAVPKRSDAAAANTGAVAASDTSEPTGKDTSDLSDTFDFGSAGSDGGAGGAE
jgi:lipopolysaccharide assembly protein A